MYSFRQLVEIVVSIGSRQEGVTSFVVKTKPWCSKGLARLA